MLVIPKLKVSRSILSATVVKKPTGSSVLSMVLAGALKSIAIQPHSPRSQILLFKAAKLRFASVRESLLRQIMSNADNILTQIFTLQLKLLSKNSTTPERNLPRYFAIEAKRQMA